MPADMRFAAKSSKPPGNHVLSMILLGFCLMVTASSCLRKPISPREKLQWAFDREATDPETTHLVLTQDLPGNRDAQVVDLLLNYLKDRRHSRTANFDNIALVVAYMEDISGIQHHMESSPSGSVYRDMDAWDADIARYRDWWSSNRDRFGWN